MTTWLTRIVLNTDREDVRAEIRNAVAMHRRVMSLFPDVESLSDARSHFGVLHRIEHSGATQSRHDRRIGSAVLLVQSNTEPTYDRLPADYSLRNESRNLAPLLEALKPGRHLRYRCDANPIRRPTQRTRELYQLETTVIALHGRHADDWWHRQAERAGLKIWTHESHSVATARGKTPDKKRPGKENNVRHHRVRFEGLAEVVAPDALRQALRSGIGKGKAYGAGLLTIAPARVCE